MKCSEVPFFQLSPKSVYWINPYTLQKLGKIRHKQTKPIIFKISRATKATETRSDTETPVESLQVIHGR